MNDQTLSALTTLANKLGTTVEMLWGVLMTQAKLEGLTALLTIIVFGVLQVVVTKIVIHKTTTHPGEHSSEWENEAKFFAYMGLVILTTTSLVTILCSIELLITVIFNPEYWALKTILISL